MTKRLNSVAAAVLALTIPMAAQATNGMQLEGYGPIAAGMGGVSMALNNGVAASANNPATLRLMATSARLDLAIGHLGPDVQLSAGPMASKSGGTSYTMPAFGYARRSGDWVYGVGVFAQGGMGTEFGADSFMAMGSGKPVRSELGVGRAILPLAYKASQQLTLGGSVDLVWSTLDLRMAASGAQLGQMVTGATGNLAQALPALGGAPWARIDFSDGTEYSGEAWSRGWAAKLGFHYKLSDELSVGGAWHSRTHLSDMKTSPGGASMSAMGGFADSGSLHVLDFQMPAQTALGVAWQATPSLMVAADVKRIAWKGVMDMLRMRYDSAGMGGSVSFGLPQQWKDQTVTAIGLAWSATPALTLRAGYNHASNPIPDLFVNPLFPATVEKHYTAGLSLKFGESSEVSAALSKAPAARVVSGSGVGISHAQLNGQLMISIGF